MDKISTRRIQVHPPSPVKWLQVEGLLPSGFQVRTRKIYFYIGSLLLGIYFRFQYITLLRLCLVLYKNGFSDMFSYDFCDYCMWGHKDLDILLIEYSIISQITLVTWNFCGKSFHWKQTKFPLLIHLMWCIASAITLEIMILLPTKCLL